MPYRTINVPNSPTPIIEVLGNTLDAYTLANNDIANSVYICHRKVFNVTDSDVVQIPALGAAPLGTRESTYARTNQASPVQCLLIPGTGGWVAAPSQIQASLNALGLAKDSSVNNPSYGPATLAGQNSGIAAVNNPAYGPSTLAGQTNQNTAIPNNIAATGVPALNLKSTTTLATSQTIATGATLNLSAITGINQPAYNLHVTATAGASSTKPWYTVTVKWVDTASGFVVQVDTYTAYMSSTSNVMSAVIAGPTDADQVQISITNNDTVTMTVNTAFFLLSSRTNYTTDVVYQFWTTASMPAIPSFQIGSNTPIPQGKILFAVSRTLANGATTTPDYALPVYSGQVAIGFKGGASNNWGVKFTEQLTGTQIYNIDLSSANDSYNLFIFPRAPISVAITNNGSVSGSLNLEVLAL